MMGLVRAAIRAPSLAARLLPVALEMQLVHAWVRAFSSKTALVGPWSKGAARLPRASHSRW
jgi:hypothetical protein